MDLLEDHLNRSVINMENDNQLNSETVEPMEGEEAGSGVGHADMKQEEPPEQSSLDKPPPTQTPATSDPEATPGAAADDPTQITESNSNDRGSPSDDTGALAAESFSSHVDDSSSTKDPVTGQSSEKEPAVDESAGNEQSATSHVFDKSWSKLSKDVIVDKVKGVIYGQAIGDAFGRQAGKDLSTIRLFCFFFFRFFSGLATEFLSRKAARKHYKTGPRGYSDIIQDFHRSRYHGKV